MKLAVAILDYTRLPRGAANTFSETVQGFYYYYYHYNNIIAQRMIYFLMSI